MAQLRIEVDPTKPAEAQREVLQNRWHPDIPAIANVKPGEIFTVECLDWTAGQIRNDDRADDIRDMDLTPNHHLTGPIYVDGAEPGDLLVVDILDIGPHPKQNWGYTGIFSKKMEAVSLPTISPTPIRRFGISTEFMPVPGTFREFAYPPSPIPESWERPLPTNC